MGYMLLKMSVTVLVICGLAAALWLLDNKTPFQKMETRVKRLIIGVLFGGAAVFSTHFCAQYGTMALNIRDIAPLCAGLIFNPWAGIIAGVIGGLERFIAGQFFDVGYYTRIACSLSSIMAGIIAALLSIHLFDKKRPPFFYAAVIGAVMEVFHMLMILLTHMNDISQAFDIVSTCAGPMILFTALGCAAATALVSALSGQYKKGWHRTEKADTPISKTFQLWLLVFVSVALLLTFLFTYVAQTRMTLTSSQELMQLNVEDVKRELENNEENMSGVKSLLKQQALALAYSVSNDVSIMGKNVSSEQLQELADLYGIYEINLINQKGVISSSSNPERVGFNMSSSSMSSPFLVLLDGITTEYLQDFRPISYENNVSLMYAGVAHGSGFVQVGYDKSNIAQFETLADVTTVAADRHVGKSGFVLLTDEDGTVISGSEEYLWRSLSELGMTDSPKQSGDFFYSTLNGTKCYCLFDKINDSGIYIVMPTNELYESRNIFAYEIAFMEILLFSVIFALILQLVRTSIVSNLQKVNRSLSRITGGDLDEVVDVRTNAEFTSLSHEINSTVSTLKHYISEAEMKIDKELEFARAIQLSALPDRVPIFADRLGFNLYARMKAAREVGGDFYDYFFADADHLVLVIADVSGKGIPASLFMMKSKTLIKTLAENGMMSPARILSTANKELCAGNDAEMFVTVWLGVLNIHTGEIVCSNGGHEYPCIKRKGGSYELYRDKHGLVLAGMETSKYQEYTLQLNPGDNLFVYTDGATEATDIHNKMYGTPRMLETLNKYKDDDPQETMEKLLNDIDRFVGKAAQFDDITILCVGIPLTVRQNRLELQALDIELERVQDFVSEIAEAAGADPRTLMRVTIAVEEIFINICHYAYGGQPGDCAVECYVEDGKLIIRFIDSGIPYNPLVHEDPDITIPLEQRKAGGLGILMTKKFMDSVFYEYRDGNNILTAEKLLSAPENSIS